MSDVDYSTESNVAAQNQHDGVKIKESAIERDINPDGVGSKGEHLPPYHNPETYQLAKDRAEEQKGQNKPYEFKANGYTVTERDAREGEIPNPIDPAVIEALGDQYKPKMYDVTAGDFLMTFNTARAAENYALTHAEAHKDLPATVSKA